MSVVFRSQWLAPAAQQIEDGPPAVSDRGAKTDKRPFGSSGSATTGTTAARCEPCQRLIAEGVRVYLCSECGYTDRPPEHFRHECSGWTRERLEGEYRTYSDAERRLFDEEHADLLGAHPKLERLEAARRAAALVLRARSSGYFERHQE